MSKLRKISSLATLVREGVYRRATWAHWFMMMMTMFIVRMKFMMMMMMTIDDDVAEGSGGETEPRE